MFNFSKDTNKISRYFISPGVCEQPDGKFQSAVSLKSGQGSIAQDTVYTFSKLFETAHEAVEHAKLKGIQIALSK